VESPKSKLSRFALLKSLKRAPLLGPAARPLRFGEDEFLHFTSPIRRYADLVVHRRVGYGRSATGRRGEAPRRSYRPDMGEVTSVAEHISATERNAADAEIDAAQMKKL